MILPIWVDGNRELITVLEAISSDGQALPPIIIYKGAALYTTWTKEVEANRAAYFAHTSSGYTNDDLTYQ